MTADPFGTARLRSAVLDAWSASPARFREDANAEEDHARGYYRDRVVVELAQNARDAAARRGVPGRLLLRLRTTPDGRGTLVALNTGAPLDADGVASLASLRASAKRDADATITRGTAGTAGTAGAGGAGGAGAMGTVPAVDTGTVGRFGVGFAAVRAVADEVTVVTRADGSPTAPPAHTAVHFSVARTAEALRSAAPALAAEVARRGGSLPALRLPFAGPHEGVGGDVLEGVWDTAVVLELRDASAVRAVRDQLAAVGDPLLLALPGLDTVEADADGDLRVVADVRRRWVVATRSGLLDTSLLADRPVEERDRRAWQVTWAVPRPTGGELARATTAPWPAVVHAPTPTDEPCTVPALLVATFPLDPARRHVAPGGLTDALVGHAGRVWVDLLEACRDAGEDPAPDPLDLVPTGLPAGALDAALREVVVEASRTAPVLLPVDGGPAFAARDALVLDGPGADDRAVVEAVGAWVPNLVDLDPRHRTLVGVLRIARTDLADVVHGLPTLEPARQRVLYEAFAHADAATLEQLATLPVPLVDGRTVRGARGLVLVDADVPADVLRTLAAWGLRIVDPGAAHPVLERLGATRAGVAGLLRHPVVRQQVLDADPDEPDDELPGDEPVAEVVLGLVGAALDAGVHLDPAPWWGELLLRADDGDMAPARGLVRPGSDAAHWFDPDVLPEVAADLVERWGPALDVVGVRSGLTVVRLGAPAASARTGAHPGAGAGPEATGPGERLEEDDELLTEALPGWDGYVALLEDAGVEDVTELELLAVADLDAVRPERWVDVLVALASGDARRALLQRVRPPDARRAPGGLPSYTAWWLRERSGLGLGRPFLAEASERATDGSRPGPDTSERPAHGSGRAARADAQVGVVALLGPPPAVLAGLDDAVLRALGGVTSVDALPAADWPAVLDVLPPVGRPVDAVTATQVWRGLVRVADEGLELDVDRLPAIVDGAPTMVAAEDVAVGSPMWAQLASVGPVVVVPDGAEAGVADAFDLELASERTSGPSVDHGADDARVVTTPAVVRAAVPGVPERWVEHEDLRVDGQEVEWWVDASGEVHAATTAGLARGLAHVAGWSHRHLIGALLTDPGARDAALLDAAGDDARSVGDAQDATPGDRAGDAPGHGPGRTVGPVA
ncbi:ATP-binding protein [Actinotalea subterranea]|uniref:ATP-binding protein n=1 Tax=Actinotalea subterranea TaxID=2607497 RepID=UPI0011ECD522|nr:ATP-binding protein [Actinotalea subterranea]